jgi:hypothetical protein
MASRFIRWAEVRFGFCWHAWAYNERRRACIKCPATEEMEDDCGGWSAGQWNRIDR